MAQQHVSVIECEEEADLSTFYSSVEGTGSTRSAKLQARQDATETKKKAGKIANDSDRLYQVQKPNTTRIVAKNAKGGRKQHAAKAANVHSTPMYGNQKQLELEKLIRERAAVLAKAK
jgi:hypothetical protein